MGDRRLEVKIEQWKSKLLDLTKRNRLLNFKVNTSTVQISADIGEVFNNLLHYNSIEINSIVDIKDEVEKLTKAAINQKSKKLSEQQIEEIRKEQIVKVKQKLEKQLNKIRLQAKGSVDEKGVNTLYLAFGLLNWTEVEYSKDILRSPLLLIPVAISRDTAKDPFYIERLDDEVLFNPVLEQKFQFDHGITLSNIDLSNKDFEQILNHYKKELKLEDSWTISEEAYIGLFSFSKLVMYKDFEQYEGLIKENKLIQALAGTTHEDICNGGEIKDIADYDRIAKSEKIYQILDADSSQQEAILAAKNSVSFVMQGPPGTGKSQTIANIISEFLAEGKKVLFVSEKKAALEVVKKRLDDKGLGEYCLDLHNHNSNKKAMLEELGNTLVVKQKPHAEYHSFNEFDELKQRLNSYVDSLHTKITALNETPQKIHGNLGRLNDYPDLLFGFSNVEQVDHAMLNKITSQLVLLEELKPLMNMQGEHVWRGALPVETSFNLESNIQVRFSSLSRNLKKLYETLLKLCEEIVIQDKKVSLNTLNKLIQCGKLLELRPSSPIHWFNEGIGFSMKELLSHYQEHQKMFSSYYKMEQEVLKDFDGEILAANLENIKHTILGEIKCDFVGDDARFINSVLDNEKGIVDTLEVINSSYEKLVTKKTQLEEIINAQFSKLSLDDIKIFNKIYEGIQEIPKLNEFWLEREHREEIRQLIRENKVFFAEFNKLAEILKDEYSLNILNEDLNGILNRFLTEYTSFFRIFKGTYKSDRNLICSYQRNDQKNTYDKVIKDLRSLIYLKDKQNEIIKKSQVLTKYFGHNYNGEMTDWNKLEESIEKVFTVSDILKETNQDNKFKAFLLSLTEEKVKSFNNVKDDLEKLLIIIKKNINSLISMSSLHMNEIAEDMDLLNFSIQEIQSLLSEMINAKHEIQQYSKGIYIKTIEDFTDLFQKLQLVHDQEKQINDFASSLQEYYGELYQGYETDWNNVEDSIKWAMQAHELFNGDFPRWFKQLLCNKDKEVLFIRECSSLVTINHSIQEDLNYYTSVVSESERKFNGDSLHEASIELIAHEINIMSSNAHKLEEWINLKKRLDDAYKLGLEEFLEKAKLMNYEFPLQEVFMKQFYRLWLDNAYNKLPILKSFHIEEYRKRIKEFKNHDLRQIQANGNRISQILENEKEAYLDQVCYSPELNVLRREIQKQKRHKPIRKLFSEISELLLVLKPCMMMSPMSVSQFIDPSILEFDLIIFDEASQMRSEDAIGSLLRGKQVIIAGDDKQLPPTAFFSQQIEVDDEFIDDEDQELYENFESILDECLLFMPQFSLKWHYRSKQESLIAFSNKEIYNNELYTFPSSIQGKHDGVSLVYVEDAIYDRGKSKRNMKEAEKIAQLVLEHVQRSPERSLGIIAFSEAQQEVIKDKIDEMREKHPEIEQFFNEDCYEAFFVKNLENVQGDERDTIILSVGYGKDENGVLYYNFGPLNKDGGERRLNVAVTRARKEIKVVSSILDTDMDDTKLKKRGPQLLKSYITFAKSGGKFTYNNIVNENADFDSPFEKDVYDMLRKKGIELHKQVGCSGYRIDLAVVHPANPGQYIMGIECDGATYHSSKTARDRDRLRQSVLESLGWKIRRIWSQDWVKRKKEITEAIVEEINELIGEKVT
ncbi:DUF4011 domain-containing protein [Bacillus rhizoplanae]|uniref:DUF4011 domain-containing protein n=1 Tax=Bacillus rhizoplanae TaxID=2880966 RepID=UPI003D1D919F